MSKIRVHIAQLLDEQNIKKSWSAKLTTYVIVGLILLSSAQVFLEADIRYAAYDGIFDAINLFCILVFSLELILRIWTADLVDSRFAGLKGRLVYLTTPYAVIDLIAVVPSAISLVLPGSSWAVLKVLRILRLLKLARFIKSFNFIIEATRKKKGELWTSMQVLLLLTLVLSVLLHHVENAAQPEEFSSIWQAMVWSLSQYIGDIGGYADFQPITAMGKLLATGVGILSIALFAVPSGIIASGFVEEMDEEKKAAKVKRDTAWIELSFRPKKVATMMGLKLPARKRTLPFLQAKLELTPEEILIAVRSSKELRLRWEKSSPELKISDLTVVEHFHMNRSYGFELDGVSSNVMIVNPQGRGERGISHFGYVLASAGQHHFVSNEIFAGAEILEDAQYNLTRNTDFAQDIPPHLDGAKAFIDDMLKAAQSSVKWIVVLRSSASHRKAQVHITFGGEKGDSSISEVKSPTVDPASLQHLEDFIERTKKALESIGLLAQTHEDFPSTSPNLLHQYLRKHSQVNVVSIFVSVEALTAANKDYYALTTAIAPCLESLK